METNFSADSVLRAIRNVYHSNDPDEQTRASQWLHDFQFSVHAWQISDELLHRKCDVESYFFAAQTMKTKIQRCFAELPPDVHVSLRESLFEHILSLPANMDHKVVVQLSIAMADLILQMSEWNNALSGVMERMTSTDGSVVPLLEILTLLPEEVYSRHLQLSSNRRRQVIDEIRAKGPAVLRFLESCVSFMPPPQVNPVLFRSNILKCLASWISMRTLSWEDLINNSVMRLVFQVLQNPNEHDDIHLAATCAMCSVVERLETLDDQQPVLASLELTLFTFVRDLDNPYKMTLTNEDNVKAMSYCRIFTEFSESTLTRMIDRSMPPTPHFAIEILRLVLLCCEHPDYEVSESTFNLWYRMSDELHEKDNKAVIQLFRPYVEDLILRLCRNCQMEPDRESVLADGEDFANFRLGATELIKDIVYIVGETNVFNQLFQDLKKHNRWEATEASLYVMAAVARNINTSEEGIVPLLLGDLLSLPDSTHVAVRHTAMALIGELAEWMDHHTAYLDNALVYVVNGLRNEHLSDEAAASLQRLCFVCRRHMVQRLDGLLNIVQGLDGYPLKPSSANYLLKGVAVVVGDLSAEEIREKMEILCLLQLTPLKAIIHGTVTGDPIIFMDRLATLFRYVTPEIVDGADHPCAPVAMGTWSVLSEALTKYQSDSRLMERCCRTIRFIVRSIRTQASGFIKPLAEQMATQYKAHPFSCILYLSSILVDEFYSVQECVDGLLSLFEHFLPVTFQLLPTDSIAALKSHPDTVDDFFRLNTRFIQRATLAYLSRPFVPAVIERALEYVFLDHREANCSVMGFFYHLLCAGRNRDDKADFELRARKIGELVNRYGAKLTDNIVRAAVFHLPRYTHVDLGEVIFELMQYDRVQVCSWLEESLKKLLTTTASSAKHQTVTLTHITNFYNEVTKSEMAKDVTLAITDFNDLFR